MQHLPSSTFASGIAIQYIENPDKDVCFTEIAYWRAHRLIDWLIWRSSTDASDYRQLMLSPNEKPKLVSTVLLCALI